MRNAPGIETAFAEFVAEYQASVLALAAVLAAEAEAAEPEAGR